MRKLLVLPLMLVAMPCAFALNTNPITSSYGSHAACGRACTLSYCYSKIEQVCPSGWTTNSSGVCTRKGETGHDTTNHRYITAVFGSCSPTTEEVWYCANSCPRGCEYCCPTGESSCTTCPKI